MRISISCGKVLLVGKTDNGHRKDPGPEDSALVQPWKGVRCDLADFRLLLEYWSIGKLETTQTSAGNGNGD